MKLLEHPKAIWLVVVPYLLGLGLVWPGLSAGLHVDEPHFLRSIQYLADHPTLEGLRTYPEMSGPLPFALYAVWGGIWGNSIEALRVLSLLVALCTFLFLHRLLRHNGVRPSEATLMVGWVMLNPYLAGLSLYVYTDMITLLFLLLSIWGWQRGNAWVFGVFAAFGCISRQYAVFWPMTVGAWSLLSALWPGLVRAPRWGIWVSALSVLPLASLMLLWEGLAPVYEWRARFLSYGVMYQFPALWLYLGLLPLLLAPWALPFLWRSLRKTGQNSRMAWVGAFVLALVYWLRPMVSSPVVNELGILHVGLFHRFLDAYVPALTHPVFYVLLALGLRLFYELVLRMGVFSPTGWMLLAMAGFLGMMPFSYMTWEKYVFPLEMLTLLALAVVNRKEAGALPTPRPA